MGPTYVVVGGGIAGLMAARSLKLAEPRARITLLERGEALGGLLGGVAYEPPGAYFDQGTHIFRETGIREIDEFVQGSVASEDLILFEPGEGDVAGSVFGGRLRMGTHFPDIRGEPNHARLLRSLQERAEATRGVEAVDRCAPLEQVAADRFGSPYGKEVLAPVLARAYQRSADELAGFAMLLPGLTRVVAFDHAEWIECVHDSNHRSIFGVPDQRQLPARFRSPHRSYYSRRLGSRAFIDGIAAALSRDGVDVICGVTIRSLDLADRVLIYASRDGEPTTVRPDGIVIAVGAIGAAHLLGIEVGRFSFDRPMAHRIVNIVLQTPTEGDLCYFYGLDKAVDFYRVTNYRAFSADSADRRLTIEVLGEPIADDASLPAELLKQLRTIGFLQDARCSFAQVLRLAAGFPAPTVRNLAALNALGAHIGELLPEWAILGGIGARNGLFFQNEVVTDLYIRAGHLVRERTAPVVVSELMS